METYSAKRDYLLLSGMIANDFVETLIADFSYPFHQSGKYGLCPEVANFNTNFILSAGRKKCLGPKKKAAPPGGRLASKSPSHQKW
jgi:hypothetical protein